MEYVWRDVTAGQFSELLLQIGDGNYPESERKIIIPSGYAWKWVLLKYLLAEIYPDVKEKPMDLLCERAILTPKKLHLQRSMIFYWT